MARPVQPKCKFQQGTWLHWGGFLPDPMMRTGSLAFCAPLRSAMSPMSSRLVLPADWLLGTRNMQEVLHDVTETCQKLL